MVLSRDLKYGSPINETKNWSGIIGMLQRNEVDLSIMDLTVLLERAEVVLDLNNISNTVIDAVIFIFIGDRQTDKRLTTNEEFSTL